MALNMDASVRKPTNKMSPLEPNARQRLLETATELFAEKGYAGTSVREIVDRAGVSKPVLYYYFKSKEGLFYAILEWAADAQQEILNEIFANAGTALDRFIYFYRRISAGVEEYQNLYKMIHGLMYGPPQGAPAYDFPKYQRHMFDAVKQIYTSGLSVGEVKAADEDEVAFLVLSLIDFSLNMNQVLPELADPQRPERLLRLAFQGLSREKSFK
jgi:TetR/AcrR family transcriptional regulator